MGTDGDKDGVVVLLQGAEGHVHTDFGVENDVDPSPLNVANLPLDDIARQTIVGNAIAHDAAGTVLRLVNIDMVAQPGQVVGTGQTGGASADDGDLLIQLRNGLEVLVRGEALGIGPVGGETLQFADVHGLVHGTAAAAALAGMGTDTAADAREGIVAEHHPGGAHVIASGDEAHVAGDVDASGAGVLAGAGNQLAANTSGTSLLHDVLLILRPEVLDGRQNRVGCRLSQAAHGGILDDGAQVLQGFDVPFLALAGGDAVEDFQHPLGADTAGSTLAAGLLLDEVQVEPGGVHHAGVLIHDDEAAGTHDGAQRCQGLIVQRGVDVFGGDTATGGATGLGRLELLPVGDAAADGIDDFGQGGTHGNFHQAGVHNVAGQGKNLGAGALLRAELTEPVGPIEHDGRYRSQGFHVVDDGGLTKQAALEGEGRLLPRFEAMRAVSSPQTKAPAPMRISMSKSKPEPKMSFPRTPSSRAISRAACRRSTAMGYSARMYTTPWLAPMA